MDQMYQLIRLLFICSLCAGSSACTDQTAVVINKEAEASYSRLCKIYEDLNSNNLDSDAIVVSLVTRIHSEVPELSYVTKHIFNASPEKVYGLYRDSALEAIGRPWECLAIKEHYQKSWKE